MTNVEALKEVYIALGGNSANFAATTNAEAIHLISTVIADAIAAELPKVTSSDNGKVLTVDGGKWKAKALPE